MSRVETRQHFETGSIYENSSRVVTSWLHGPSHDKYMSLNQSAGLLGMPKEATVTLTNPVECLAEVCERTRFERGRIYYKESIGAFELHGDVLSHYLSVGGLNGELGWPTTDVTETPTGAHKALFEGGKIRCTRPGVCRVIV